MLITNTINFSFGNTGRSSRWVDVKINKPVSRWRKLTKMYASFFEHGRRLLAQPEPSYEKKCRRTSVSML